MKNNQYDGLNYQKAKRQPIDDLSQWYAENGKSKANDSIASDSAEAIRQKQARGEQLSPMEALTLGFANLNRKNEAESQSRQKSANDIQKAHDEEMISADSEEWQTLANNMAQLQAEFQKMNGAGEE
ncbi:hypothetical protein ACFRCQ_07560 [Cytobacillus firmus]|uniref:hypothetical protein n=1 Tax=Cytobacillus firmus TaxID=1399 RepID=UPI0036AB6544